MRYLVGDLLEEFREGEVDVIGHQCNCFNIMGAGVARLIADEYPEALEADRGSVIIRDGKPADPLQKLGHFTMLPVRRYSEMISGYIFNLYGQGSPNAETQQTNYVALSYALRGMASLLRGLELAEDISFKIGFPKIGAGLGGGKWETIEQLIEYEFTGMDVTIYVLTEDELPVK